MFKAMLLSTVGVLSGAIPTLANTDVIRYCACTIGCKDGCPTDSDFWDLEMVEEDVLTGKKTLIRSVESGVTFSDEWNDAHRVAIIKCRLALENSRACQSLK